MNQKAMMALIAILGALGVWNAWRAHQMSEEVKILQEKLISSTSLKINDAENGETNPEKDSLAKNENEKTETTDAKEANSESSKTSRGWGDRSKRFGSSASSTPKTEEVRNVLSALSHPDVQQRIGNISKSMAQKQEDSKWEAKKEVNKEARQFELQGFADEKGYSDDVKSQLNEIVDKYSDESTNIWQRVNDGEISWMDARSEWKDLKEDRESQLTNLIGEEDYGDLKERVWGKWR